MQLSRPTNAVFLIAVVLAVLAAVVRFTTVSIPVVSVYPFEILLIAFILLVLGNLVRGL
jgi:hypothetical protein